MESRSGTQSILLVACYLTPYLIIFLYMIQFLRVAITTITTTEHQQQLKNNRHMSFSNSMAKSLQSRLQTWPCSLQYLQRLVSYDLFQPLGSQVSIAVWGHCCFHCHIIILPPCLSFNVVLFFVNLYPNCIVFKDHHLYYMKSHFTPG